MNIITPVETVSRANSLPGRAEWRWAVTVSLLVVGLAALPCLWAWFATPSGGEFGGFLFNAHDGNTYLAKMDEGRRGSWVFHLAHTPETGGPGAATFEFYLVLGKLAGLLNLPNLIVFHLARLAFGLVLLLVSYAFVAWLFDDQARRRFTFGLVCLAAGLGWLLAPLGLIASPAPDLLVAEGYTFQSIFANPHFCAATVLLIGSIWLGYLALERQAWRWWAGSAGLALVMGFVHPFLLLTVGGGLGLVWLRRMITNRRFDRAGLVGLLGVGLVGSLGLLLTWWGTQSDPLLRQWMDQNQVPNAGPLWLVGGYGLLVPLGVAGAWWVERQAALSLSPVAVGRWRLVVGWAALSAVLPLLPISFGLKFIEGLHLPLCCLAALGYYEVVQPRLPRRRRLLARQALLLVSAISTLTLVVTAISYIYTPTPRDNLYELLRPPYLSAGEVGAINYLRDQVQPDEVVLSGPILGNVLPGRLPVRAFWGHSIETLDPAGKAAALSQFYDPATAPAVRQALISRWHLRYLLYGWRERQIGDFDPATGGWSLVYDSNGLQVYRL